MNATTPIKHRLSRWSRDHVCTANGRAAHIALTDRDLDTFKLLARFRYLPADYIHQFVGGYYKHLIERLSLLYRKPNQYINRPHQQREHAEANHRTLIYELDDRGKSALRERGMTIPKRKRASSFAHDLMCCQIAASIDIGLKATSAVNIIRWSSILSSDKLPTSTKSLPDPTAIPVGDGEVIPDWEPFVLVRARAENPFIFFPGFEADCGTEPLDTNNAERSSIRAKFRAYLTIMEQKIYQSHFGATTFMVPFITTSEQRMHSMINLLGRMNPGVHARRFLFKYVPSFFAHKSRQGPTGHILTEPWARAAAEPFYLNQP